MKTLLLALPFLFSTGYLWAQNTQNCNELKVEVNKLRTENEYLRSSLRISNPINTVNSDNIEFKLLKAEGNAKSQTITFTLTLKTSAANWYINSEVKSIIDIDGNEYRLNSYTVGALDYGSIKLNTDVPIKCTYTFKGVLPSVKMIKLFKLDYSHSAGEHYSAEFRDVSIDWK